MGGMGFELKPVTESGARFVAAAEELTEGFRARATDADAQNVMCAENFLEMQRVGIRSAFVPEKLGGMGLSSIHDWAAGLACLARGDGSSAIAINMHLGVSRGMVQAYLGAEAAGQTAAVEGLALTLEQIVSGDMLICATATEPGTDYLHPLTTATRTETGWEIDGTKIFVTMSPIASHLAMNLRSDDNGKVMMGSALLPIGTPGIIQNDDWNALGMRSSGSQSITFKKCVVGENGIRPMGAWGKWSPALLMNRTLGNLTLLGAFVGIAEHAREIAISSAKRSAKATKAPNAERTGFQHMIAEMEIALSEAQAMLAQAALRVDHTLSEYGYSPPPLELAHHVMKDFQSAKWIVNKRAIEVVNMAMDIAGGGGFLAGNTLSRLYRDVRAGPFMQPFSPTDARDYIGKVTVGLFPEE